MSSPVDCIPDFKGDLAKRSWYFANAGPRTREEVADLLVVAFKESLTYADMPRQMKKSMYDEKAPILQRYYDRIVYTDGSVKKDRGAGYGVWWANPAGEYINGPIPDAQIPKNAELYAIYMALLYDPNSGDAIRIETDCHDLILELMCCAQGRSVQPDVAGLCQQIIDVLEMRPGPVGLGYVPGHTDVIGNEHADFLAGVASRDAQMPTMD